MTYLVTARKWRPLVFEAIVGQEHVARTLKNAIATNRLSHAYIFSGPRGVGKTTAARILAKAVNCLHPSGSNPDNSCELCTEITDGRSMNVFEIDGASNRGVDEIRNLREAVRYGPSKGKYKVYIIDEVHMLTKEAFNALLKTLEEPPPYIVFIFATTEIHKVPLTILSRCQRFDFHRIASDEIRAQLRLIADEERIGIDDNALSVIARRSDGSMRDAESIFDQIVSFCGQTIDTAEMIRMLNVVDEEIYFRATDIMKSKDAAAALSLIEEIVSRGYDFREFLAGLLEHLRNLLVVSTTGTARLVETSELYKNRYLEEAGAFSAADLFRLIKIAADTDSAIRWSQSTTGSRFKLEIGLMQMVRLDSSVQIGDVLRQIDELKKKGPPEGNRPSQASIERREPSAPAFAPKRTEAPLRGNVKASQPTLRPDQVVETPAVAASEAGILPARPAFTPPVAASRPIGEPGISPERISIDEALAKWPALVAEVSKKRILVGTMLGETALVGVGADSLRISCPDDFHIDQLVRNRQFICELAQNIYGAKFRLETILANAASRQEVPPDESSPPAKAGPADRGARVHPIVEALIREFGAREI
jgi:DNA polymerase-3 subunit gamma/tau